MTARLSGPGGTIALDAPTLAALESIDVSDRAARLLGRVTVDGGTGGATETTLAAVLTELGQKLEAGQAVALDAATLAALESITAVVSGTVGVSNFPATQSVNGTVALDGSTLNALEQVEARSPIKAMALDYAGRSDAQPVYLGSAPPATADSAVGWTVTRFTYESAAADARVTRSDVRSPIKWTSRTDPTLDGQPAW